MDLLRPEVLSGHLKSSDVTLFRLSVSTLKLALYQKNHKHFWDWNLQSIEKNLFGDEIFFLILKTASGFGITCFGSLNIIPFSHDDEKNFVVFLKHTLTKWETTWHCVSQLEILILFYKITIIFSKCIVFKEHLVFPGYLFYIACFLKSIFTIFP